MKASIRKSVLKKMKGLEPEIKWVADQSLIQRLRSLPAYQEASVIATYLSFPHEVDTSFLIDAAQADGKQVVIPKTYPKGRMEFVDYDPQNLKQTAFGLLEPEDGSQAIDQSEIDLIHVPGVAFQKDGYRLGYGGGYYDRYLADFDGATVSTIYACQEVNFLPASYDIPVQEVLVDESTI
ncbi:5-formyltetrahydrofolate cyclo-ligase [Streptococcus australis]|nr:5-formyltetrahydrofolate cyclo-ligase [Streptococcus australis]EGU63592.1 5-formyltetrahydrofolate cyclo-ligase [Streptococcus australis ATCC 700641]